MSLIPGQVLTVEQGLALVKLHADLRHELDLANVDLAQAQRRIAELESQLAEAKKEDPPEAT